MGDRKENVGKGLGQKDLVIRHISMDDDGIWNRNMGMERKKSDKKGT